MEPRKHPSDPDAPKQDPPGRDPPKSDPPPRPSPPVNDPEPDSDQEDRRVCALSITVPFLTFVNR